MGLIKEKLQIKNHFQIMDNTEIWTYYAKCFLEFNETSTQL